MTSGTLVFSFVVACSWLCAAARLGSNIIQLSSNCSGGELNSSTPAVSTNSSADGPCVSIDAALESMESDTVLQLDPGNYTIAESHLLYGLSNVGIVGSDTSGGVNIICEIDAGIAFVNVTDFTMASLSIAKCGLNRETIQNATDLLKEIVDVWFLIPARVRIALFVGYGRNLNMTNVNISETRGLGMLAINIMGYSSLSSILFTHNIRASCISERQAYPYDITSEVLDQIGGGAYFLYFDFFDAALNQSPLNSSANVVNISNSVFSFNADCSYAALTYLNYKYFPDSINRYMIGAGGGLSVIYAHSSFSIATNVTNTVFYKNDARYGGGAHVGTFANFSLVNSVSFANCDFIYNGLESGNQYFVPYSSGGAGLAVFSDLFKPAFLDSMITKVNNITVSIENTRFEKNRAMDEGGGMYAYSLDNSPHRVNSPLSEFYFSIEWRLVNVVFSTNEARLVAAASFIQRTFHGIDGSAILFVDSVEVRNSHASVDNLRTQLDDVNSAMAVKNVRCQMTGSSLFEGNEVSALHIVSTILGFVSNSRLEFRRNIGFRGGAIYFEGNSPTLLVLNNVSIVFSENVANIEGGAIYFASPLFGRGSLQPLNYFGCFINTQILFLYDFFISNITLEFYNNSAPVGSSVFGTSLEVCPWASKVMASVGNIYEELYTNYNSTFVFSEPPVGRSQVSTTAFSINVSAPAEVIPGELVDVNITVFDHFVNEIFSVVTTDTNSDIGYNSALGDSGYWFTARENPTLQIFGFENTSVNISYFTYINVVTSTLEVNLLTCPAGFDFNNTTSNKGCACSKELRHFSSDVVCHPKSMMLSVAGSTWIGTELSKVNSTLTGDLIIHSCYFDYCNPTTFRPPNYNSQCDIDSHRTGIMCGACDTEKGYSAVFGTSVCMKCSHYYLLLIPLFAVVGILVFLVIAFLEFTVDKGWMYAVIYYSNFLTLYSYQTMPIFKDLSLLFVPGQLLSLQLGFSLCFFDGMTALARAGILLIFPIYLYILMLIFKLLAQRYSLSCYFHPARTFVTLNVLCYVSLLGTCVDILSGTQITTIDGKNSIRWLTDPNQLYFHGWHALTGIIAIFIGIVLIIAFPFTLLFPTVIYKYKFFKSGKPFYDALYAPYKEKYRYWLGLRLIALCVISIMASLLRTNTSLLINTLILVGILHIQATIKPYKNYWLNIADSYFIMQIILVLIGASSYLNSGSSPVEVRVTYTLFAIGLSYCLVVAIFLHHLDMRFPKVKEKLFKWTHMVINRSRRKKASKNDFKLNMRSSCNFPSPAGATTTDVMVDGAGMKESDMNSPRGSGANYRDSIFEDSI